MYYIVVHSLRHVSDLNRTQFNDNIDTYSTVYYLCKDWIQLKTCQYVTTTHHILFLKE